MSDLPAIDASVSGDLLPPDRDTAYLQEWKSRKDVATAFETTIPDAAEILIAWRGYGSYCGSAFVLYRLDGKLYEVNASHCSCNGVEGQWSPEETTVAALRMREFSDNEYAGNLRGEYDGVSEAKRRLKEVLDALEPAA